MSDASHLFTRTPDDPRNLVTDDIISRGRLASATPAKRDRLGRLLPGESANPRGDYSPRKHALLEAIERATDFDKLAAVLWQKAEAGEPWAVQYIVNQLVGLPVQRHEAKLMSEVDETTRLLAARFGLPESEVRERARQIARGT